MQRIIIGILLWIILGMGIAFMVGDYAKKDAYSELSEELNSLVQVRLEILERFIERRRKDARFLVNVPPVPGIVRASNAQQFDALENSPLDLWKRRLETIFIAFVSANPEVKQIRLIGIADQGREIIRVENKNGQVIARKSSEMQQKANSKYFQKSLSLHPDEVYVSDLELNREFGKIEEPHWPTWRAIAPSFDESGNLFGFLVLNLDGNYMLNVMRSTLPKKYEIFIFNSDEQFVLHHDNRKVFLQDLGKSWKWSDQFKKVQGHNFAGDLELYSSANGKYFAVLRALPLNPNDPQSRKLTIAAVANESIVMDYVRQVEYATFIIIICCGAIMMGLNYLMIRQKLKMNMILENQVKERTREFLEISSLQKAILTNAFYAIIATDPQGIVTLFNPAAEKMLGYTAEEIVGKQTPLIWHDMNEIVRRADKFSQALKKPIEPGLDALFEESRAGLENQHEWTFIRKDGTRLPVMLGITILYGAGGSIVGYLGIAVDITMQQEYEAALRLAKEKADADSKMLKIQAEKLREMTTQDALTGLANRRYFDEQLELASRHAKRTGLPLTILMMDVDYFKNYNDHYGHQAGDKVLQLVAEIFKEHISRAGDIVARYGGEEFAILLPETDLNGAKEISEILLNAVRNKHFEHGSSHVASILTISIGVAVARLDRTDEIADLMRQADSNLYQAKREGRNRVVGNW